MYLIRFDAELNIYFIDYDSKKVIQYIPFIKNKEIELTEEIIKNLLIKLDIKLLPFNKVHPNFKIEEGYKYDYGLSNVLKGGEKFISINPTSEYTNFVLLHELGHLLLEHKYSNLDRVQRELESNTVAFLVSSSFYNKQILANITRYFCLYFSNISEESCNKCIEVADKILHIILEYK